MLFSAYTGMRYPCRWFLPQGWAHVTQRVRPAARSSCIIVREVEQYHVLNPFARGTCLPVPLAHHLVSGFRVGFPKQRHPASTIATTPTTWNRVVRRQANRAPGG